MDETQELLTFRFTKHQVNMITDALNRKNRHLQKMLDRGKVPMHEIPQVHRKQADLSALIGVILTQNAEQRDAHG